jgi:hypothetical protein
MHATNEIWPTGVGYDTTCGYTSKVYDHTTDPIEKLCALFIAWKNTASNHNFTCTSSAALTCRQSRESHLMTLPTEDSGSKVLLAKVHTLEVSADVDSDPEDTCINITIQGLDFKTKQRFDYRLTIYRHPTKKAASSLKFKPVPKSS